MPQRGVPSPCVVQPASAAFGFELPEPRRLRGGYNGRSGSDVDATRPRDRGNSTKISVREDTLLGKGKPLL
jgi:hypothetical protein